MLAGGGAAAEVPADEAFVLEDPELPSTDLEKSAEFPNSWRDSWTSGEAKFIKLFDVKSHPASAEHMASVQRFGKFVGQRHVSEEGWTYDEAGFFIDHNKKKAQQITDTATASLNSIVTDYDKPIIKVAVTKGKGIAYENRWGKPQLTAENREAGKFVYNIRNPEPVSKNRILEAEEMANAVVESQGLLGNWITFPAPPNPRHLDGDELQDQEVESVFTIQEEIQRATSVRESFAKGLFWRFPEEELRNYISFKNTLKSTIYKNPATLVRVGQVSQIPRHMEYAPGWCRVQNIAALIREIEAAQSRGRAICVAVAHNMKYWEDIFWKMSQSTEMKEWEKIFGSKRDLSITESASKVRWSFATVNENVWNQYLAYGGRFPESCSKLHEIGGIHRPPIFFTVDCNGGVKHFCGNSVQSEDIVVDLKKRLESLKVNKGVSDYDLNALSSSFEVNHVAAWYSLVDSMTCGPDADSPISFRFRIAKSIDTVEAGPFTPPNAANIPPSPHPPQNWWNGPLLREDQLRSIRWMVAREAKPAKVIGAPCHRLPLKSVPPFGDLVAEWEMRGTFTVNGGVLADKIGFGKTAVCLGLLLGHPVDQDRIVVPESAMGRIPTRCSLAIVPPHMVEEWKREVIKFSHGGALIQKMKCVETIGDLPSRHELVNNLRLLVVSNKLWESSAYRAGTFRKPETNLGIGYIRGCNSEAHVKKITSVANYPPLEAFYWDRVFVDEIHEFTIADGPSPLPVENIHCRAKWGLTGTPPVITTGEVRKLAKLFRVELGLDNQLAERFVQQCVRQSSMDSHTYPAPSEYVISHQLTATERALYCLEQFEQREKLQSGSLADRLSVAESLLEQVCHHSKESIRINDASEDVSNVMRLKNPETASQVASQLREERENQVAHQKSIIKKWKKELAKAGTNDTSHQALGKRDQALDRIDVARDVRNRALQASNIFEQSLRASGDDNNDVDEGVNAIVGQCPVTLKDITKENGFISKEGIMYHKHGARKCVEEGRCFVSNKPISEDDFIKVSSTAVDEWMGPSPSFQAKNNDLEAGGKYSLYGSKLASVFALLEHIKKCNSEQKNIKNRERVLVFCKYPKIINKIKHGLVKTNLARADYVHELELTGAPSRIRRCIENFRDNSKIDTHWLLMMPLASKVAGMNLQEHASTIIFVHPFFASSCGQASAWEAQAIGRLLREGQKKEVKIYRCLCMASIDVHLVAHSRLYSDWSTYFKTMAELEQEKQLALENEQNQNNNNGVQIMEGVNTELPQYQNGNREIKHQSVEQRNAFELLRQPEEETNKRKRKAKEVVVEDETMGVELPEEQNIATGEKDVEISCEKEGGFVSESEYEEDPEFDDILPEVPGRKSVLQREQEKALKAQEELARRSFGHHSINIIKENSDDDEDEDDESNLSGDSDPSATEDDLVKQTNKNLDISEPPAEAKTMPSPSPETRRASAGGVPKSKKQEWIDKMNRKRASMAAGKPPQPPAKKIKKAENETMSSGLIADEMYNAGPAQIAARAASTIQSAT